MPSQLQKQQITVYDTDRSKAAMYIKFLFIIINLPVMLFNKIISNLRAYITVLYKM